jgi:hypothetical protein
VDALAAVLIAALAVNSASFEADGVRVDVTVEAQIFTFDVTNVDAPTIMRVAIGSHHTYNHKAPNGWELEHEDAVLRAWTTEYRQGIARGRTKTFSVRVGSHGAVLGRVPVTVGFDGDRADLTIEDVWGPVGHPRGILLLVPTMVAAIGLFHAFLTVRRDKRR